MTLVEPLRIPDRHFLGHNILFMILHCLLPFLLLLSIQFLYEWAIKVGMSRIHAGRRFTRTVTFCHGHFGFSKEKRNAEVRM